MGVTKETTGPQVHNQVTKVFSQHKTSGPELGISTRLTTVFPADIWTNTTDTDWVSGTTTSC